MLHMKTSDVKPNKSH